MASQNVQSHLQGQLRELKINRLNPDKITPIHVNDMIINHDGKEFFITFSEIEPPTIMDENDAKRITSVDCITKVKIVVAPEFAELMVKAMNEGVEKLRLVRKDGAK